MAKAAKQHNNYLQNLLAKAVEQYPFLRQYDPALTLGKGSDYAETWPVGETGTPDSPRPSDIPISRTGVQVFRPGSFGPSDLAAEFLHVDPYAHYVRDTLESSLTPSQIASLKHESGDYADTLKQGGSTDKATQNAIDSAMRGYTVSQWPADANARMQYSPQQVNYLQNLRSYMQTGVVPLDYDLSRR